MVDVACRVAVSVLLWFSLSLTGGSDSFQTTDGNTVSAAASVTGQYIYCLSVVVAWPTSASLRPETRHTTPTHPPHYNYASLLFTRSSAIAEGPRDASCQLKSCQLPCNSAETTCTTSPEQIEVMKLDGYSGPMRNKHVHSTITPSSRFQCLIGVINKPTTNRVVYQRLAVAKFSKSTM